MKMSDHNILDALCRNLAGKPASACDWRELLRVRDAVEQVLNEAVNRSQSGPLRLCHNAPTDPQDAA